MIDVENCLKKQDFLISRFSSLSTPKERYELLIDMGRDLRQGCYERTALPQNLVQGCQSQVFLSASLTDGKIFFETYSEALISSGLVALLLFIYQGEEPEVLLTCPPLCLEKMGIYASLSPGRSNGLSNIYLRMKQLAIYFCVPSSLGGKESR